MSLARDARNADMVRDLAKPGETIATELTGDQAHMLHMVMGIAGESGEIVDAIKKHVVYRKPLDLDNVIEELGDLEFYMEGLRQAVGVSRKTILDANYHKLRGPNGRYPDAKYSDQQAQDRADKA